MRFNCGPTMHERWLQKIERRKEWHQWFAWRPVRVGPQRCVWLETVERRGDYWADPYGCGWDYEYRLLTV